MGLIRARISKEGDLKFISHLDMMKVVTRALRRAELPISYSQGYNPRPQISLGPPLPVGLSSQAEYIDFELEEEMSADSFLERLKWELPSGMDLKEAWEIEKGKSLMAILDTACYHLPFYLEEEKPSVEEWKEKFDDLLSAPEIIVERKRKKKKKRVNLKPLIREWSIKECNQDHILLEFFVRTGSRGNVRPEELGEIVCRSLEKLKPPSMVEVVRIGLYREVDGTFMPPD